MDETVKRLQGEEPKSKLCHRTIGPHGILTDSGSSCIREKCSLWSADHEACGDLVLAYGTAKLAESGLRSNELDLKSLEVFSSLAVSCEQIAKYVSRRKTFL